jgi:DeoR family fructose operon transcriptional repressor
MALFVEERRRLILIHLRQHGRVSVKDLSDRLAVSAVTIRQDLRALESDGLLERTYGGAVKAEMPSLMPELSFHVRMGKKRSQKDAIAQSAVALVHDGYSIALDCSTTVYALAPLLKRFSKLTVVTNSLIVAQTFLDSPHVTVLMPGGRMRRDSISLVGRLDSFPEINLNIGFFGARGIAPHGDVSDVDLDECATKSAMVSRCAEVVVLTDGGKWGQIAPYTFARFSQVQRFITTEDAPAELVHAVRACGPLVDLVRTSRRN